MRVMKAPILLSTALAICALDMSAQHFEADGIAYDIIASGQVEVSASNPEQPYKRFVIIPGTVNAGVCDRNRRERFPWLPFPQRHHNSGFSNQNRGGSVQVHTFGERIPQSGSLS